MRKVFLLFCFFVFYEPCFGAINYSIIPSVIVTPKKYRNHSFTHGSKVVLTQQDISASGATSIAQVLQEIGGVQLQDITGNGSQVALSMRGFGSNASSNTLLLINGIPITNPDLAPPDLNAIPIQEVEAIEIIAGTESVLYGDQAVGGTINIITQQCTKQKITLSYAGGSYNQNNAYATIQDHYRNLRYGFQILHNHTDNYRVHNDYDQQFLAGNLAYPYQTGALAFDFQLTNERMQYPGALTAAQVAQNRRQANNNTDFFRDWSGFYHLQHKQQFNADWFLTTDLARREMHGDGVLMSPFTQSREIQFIKPQLHGTFKKFKLLSGLDAENDKYHLQSLFGATQDTEQKYGIFSIIQYPLSTRWSVSVGARGAEQDTVLKSTQNSHSTNRAVATTLGTSYQLQPQITWYLRRAENFRFPKADENAFTPPNVTQLKTQRGVSYETGIQWNWKKLHTQLGIYQLNLRDEITFDPTQTPQTPFGSNRNLSPTERYGVSLSEKIPLTQQITLDGQYNYVNARFQNGVNVGNRIPLVSENIFHTGIYYKMTPYWNCYAEGIFTGNQYSANDDANVMGTMGGYMIYNFNLRYHFKGFSAAFRVNNIFNKYYYYYTVFQPRVPYQTFYPAAGRNLLLTLKYAFA